MRGWAMAVRVQSRYADAAAGDDAVVLQREKEPPPYGIFAP
jgi:hypothetical protein